ncbi:MAG TPA: DMT family transporter [Candidatus Limnocylindrales bacterium]
MDRRRAVGLALVVVSACSYGSGALFAKPVYAAGLDWLTLLAWRFGFGAALSWIWLLAWPARRAGLRRLTRRRALAAVALGAMYTLNSSTYFAALETVPASLTALIVYIYPVLVAVLALRFGRPLAGSAPWIALGIATLGVVLAVGGLNPATAPPLSGLVQAVVSPIIYAVWIVLQARLGGERQDRLGQDAANEDEAGAETAVAGALIMTATWAVFVVLAAAGHRPIDPRDVPVNAWPGLVGVGVVSAFIAIQAFYAGTRRVGAAQAALISTIEPLWTIALAGLLFGERLLPVQLAGGALILIAVLIAQAPAGRVGRASLRLADE